MSPVCCLRSRQMSSRALPAPAKAGVPGTHPSTSPGRPAALALARRAFPSPRRGGGRGGVNVWRNRRRLSKTSVRSRASSGPGTRSAPIRHHPAAHRAPVDQQLHGGRTPSGHRFLILEAASRRPPTTFSRSQERAVGGAPTRVHCGRLTYVVAITAPEVRYRLLPSPSARLAKTTRADRSGENTGA